MLPQVIATVIVVIALGSCGDATAEDASSPPPTSTVTFGASRAELAVAVADDDDERRRGLMDVEQLPDDEGMAFVFDEPVSGTFWMKNTLIPLSIAFVGEDGNVVGVLDMEPCEADPCPRYGVDDPYVMAIEANRGWFEDNGVGVGDRAELESGGLYG
ncbi:MAG TPA: DUF192 domain-containing protein [Actinomycetota bacterium]|nr:DUF192 domain-containing protein [Actinomycetota bacterium]